MAYEQIARGDETRGPLLRWDTPGKVIEGWYLGMREGRQFDDRRGPSRLVDVKMLDGSGYVTLTTTPGLADDLSRVPVGVLLRIEYLGPRVSQRTGRSYKAFSVMIDRDRMMNGSPDAPASLTPAAAVGVPASSVSTLEAKLREHRGENNAELVVDALKRAYPNPDEYEKHLRALLAAYGVL